MKPNLVPVLQIVRIIIGSSGVVLCTQEKLTKLIKSNQNPLLVELSSFFSIPLPWKTCNKICLFTLLQEVIAFPSKDWVPCPSTCRGMVPTRATYQLRWPVSIGSCCPNTVMQRNWKVCFCWRLKMRKGLDSLNVFAVERGVFLWVYEYMLFMLTNLVLVFGSCNKRTLFRGRNVD